MSKYVFFHSKTNNVFRDIRTPLCPWQDMMVLTTTQSPVQRIVSTFLN